MTRTDESKVPLDLETVPRELSNTDPIDYYVSINDVEYLDILRYFSIHYIYQGTLGDLHGPRLSIPAELED